MAGEMKSYYVKVRPTNGGIYVNTRSYEFWTTVFDSVTGNSYLSIQDVPAGIEITNTDYWTLYSVNDARYEYLYGLLKDIKSTAAQNTDIEALRTQLSSLIAASGETAGNTELHDIRNGADGIVYNTAGESVRQQLNKKIEKDDAMSWGQWFDLHRKAWKGGVTFPQFSKSPSAIGTKTEDNTDMVVQTSTNTTKGRNDYEADPCLDLMFNGIVVNGYIDIDGEPHIIAVKGSPEFRADGSNGDVYVAFLTPFYRRIYDDNVDGWEFSALPSAGLKPWESAVRPDGSYRSFYFMAKYPGVKNDDGIIASISGRAPVRNASHNNQINTFKAKGSQYCGFTSTDVGWTCWMSDMKFATRNSQSIMTGNTAYSYQYQATVIENEVKRIIISKAQAANLLVGSSVSIGYGTVSNGTINWDRGYANSHKCADNARILKIEDYDQNNSAVYVDVETPFSTADVKLNDLLTSPVKLSTMHWFSGSCDEVLGPDGSPTNCKNSKEPFVLSNVELGHGGYVVISDIIMNGVYNSDTDVYTQTPYIVNDSRKIATSITADYTQIGFSLPDTNNNWTYISEEGYDERYPFLLLPTKGGASSSTGYCDGLHTGTRVTGLREWLWFGYLGSGAIAGLRCVSASSAVGTYWWNFLPRLSSLRRGVAA